jgi:hypothetical protein
VGEGLRFQRTRSSSSPTPLLLLTVRSATGAHNHQLVGAPDQGARSNRPETESLAVGRPLGSIQQDPHRRPTSSRRGGPHCHRRHRERRCRGRFGARQGTFATGFLYLSRVRWDDSGDQSVNLKFAIILCDIVGGV